ncbi:MAG: aldolase/citrate lyase family protein [Gemmatimonadota bacterium]|nr:aldolase/citrate lyase family protein [Gemmatimonadota bacterium]
MAEQNLKQRIRAGQQIVGANIALTYTREQLTKIVESGEYDFIWVDGQHSAFTEHDLVDYCKITDELGADVVFRIKHTFHSYLVGNFLDLGPAGIEVPQVELESTVEEAVKYFYYPQQGMRSWGGGARRKITEVGGDRLEYAAWWNEYGVLCMQLESIPAVTNVRKLAKPGVDFFTFGPNDLRYNIEAHPNHPFGSVDDCVRHVVDQLDDSEAQVLFRNYTRDERHKYIDMGVTMFLENPVL